MERRSVLTRGLVAGLAGAVWPVSSSQAAQRTSDVTSSAQVVEALKEIQQELRQQRMSCGETLCAELELIRANQRVFLRAQGKFPDFIEVSPEIWEKVYDWFVRTGQHVEIQRLPDGRYSVPFCLTNVVLRPDVPATFITLGYDSR